MQAEEAERRTVIADSNSHEPSQDLVKLRRISLSIQSIPRSLDLHAAVGTAAQRAVSVVGQETLSDVSRVSSTSVLIPDPVCTMCTLAVWVC